MVEKIFIADKPTLDIVHDRVGTTLGVDGFKYKSVLNDEFTVIDVLSGVFSDINNAVSLQDSSYLYYVDSVGSLYKIDKNDMSISGSYVGMELKGGNRTVVIEEEYIYALVKNGTSTRVVQIDKTTMTEVSTSGNLNGNSYCISTDSNHVYIGGYGNYLVKLSKTDYAITATYSSGRNATISGIANDSNYVYFVDGTKHDLVKLNKFDLTGVSALSIINTSGSTYVVARDGYLYIIGPVFAKIRISDFMLVSHTTEIGNYAFVDVDGIYDINIAGMITKFNIDTLEKEWVSNDFTTQKTYRIAKDGEECYVVGENSFLKVKSLYQIKGFERVV